MYGIEKAQSHISSWGHKIIPLGRDFLQTTLIDKKVSAVFCNPPYSEFAEWTVKIINEARASKVFLVIPERWKNNKKIQDAIMQREAKVIKLDSFDFSKADRKARAKVELLSINLSNDWRNSDCDVDPFDAWFDSLYPKKEGSKQRRKAPIEEARESMVKGQNLIERLDELYQSELGKINKNFEMIMNIDADLLREVGVSREVVCESLAMKIKGLKSLYWKELFTNLDKITNRLTNKSRNKLLNKISSNANVDFSSDNAYNIVMWVIKNTNSFTDSQMVSLHEQLFSRESISLYKSSQRVNFDDWRYNVYEAVKAGKIRYSLDYRFVKKGYKAIDDDWNSKNGLSEDAHNIINDIITIAKTLNFSTDSTSFDFAWSSGKECIFPKADNSGPLMLVKAFKNGNLHFKFDQRFWRAFNTRVGIIRGWIKTSKDVQDELGYTKKQADETVNINPHLQLNRGNLLLTS